MHICWGCWNFQVQTTETDRNCNSSNPKEKRIWKRARFASLISRQDKNYLGCRQVLQVLSLLRRQGAVKGMEAVGTPIPKAGMGEDEASKA